MRGMGRPSANRQMYTIITNCVCVCVRACMVCVCVRACMVCVWCVGVGVWYVCVCVCKDKWVCSYQHKTCYA